MSFYGHYLVWFPPSSCRGGGKEACFPGQVGTGCLTVNQKLVRVGETNIPPQDFIMNPVFKHTAKLKELGSEHLCARPPHSPASILLPVLSQMSVPPSISCTFQGRHQYSFL